MDQISPALLTALVSTIKATDAKPDFLAVLFSTLKLAEVEKEPNGAFALKIYVRIAEILAGNFAFGSLANLNIANKAIREETTPVLFETVMMDNWPKWKYHERSNLPRVRGFQYTKYLITGEGPLKSLRPRGTCNGWHPLGFKTVSPVILDRSARFPNLIMTIFHNAFGSEGVPIHVHLHKSLTAAVAFGVILKTPLCLSQPQATTQRNIFQGPARAFRRADTLGSMRLNKGTCLLGGGSLLEAVWTTDIRLFGFHFVQPDLQPGNGSEPTGALSKDSDKVDPTTLREDDTQYLDTIMEILKLVERPEKGRRRDNIQIPHLHGISPYLTEAVKDTQWHLELSMTLEGFNAFANRVHATHLFNHSNLCRNRIKVFIDCEVPGPTFEELLHRFTCDVLLKAVSNDTRSGEPTDNAFALGSRWGVVNGRKCRQVGFFRYCRVDEESDYYVFVSEEYARNVKFGSRSQQLRNHDFHDPARYADGKVLLAHQLQATLAQADQEQAQLFSDSEDRDYDNSDCHIEDGNQDSSIHGRPDDFHNYDWGWEDNDFAYGYHNCDSD